MQVREDRNELLLIAKMMMRIIIYYHHVGDLTDQTSNLVVSVRIKGGGRLVQDQKSASSAQHR